MTVLEVQVIHGPSVMCKVLAGRRRPLLESETACTPGSTKSVSLYDQTLFSENIRINPPQSSRSAVLPTSVSRTSTLKSDDVIIAIL